jgi:type VII secretion protein EccB
MASFRLTTKVQVSGWRFLLRRLEHALVRRDTRMFDDPLQFYSRSVALGVVVSVLIVVGALAMAYFKPQGKLGSGDLFVDRTTNQLYLKVAGQLHPVYNLTSARLVLGNSAEPAAVKSAELNRLPKGQSIGIPGAPYATPVSSDSSSVWALCDTAVRAETVNPSVQTSVIAMPLAIETPAIDPLLPGEALLASYGGKDWVITATGRHATDLGDRPMTFIVGIRATAKPGPLSTAMFNALPDAGSWQLPPVPGAGSPNTLGLPDELVVGSVLQLRTTVGTRYFVVMQDGVAAVNANTAAVLRANQAYGLVVPPTLPTNAVVRIPELVYNSPLPDEPVKMVSRPDDPVLCWSWERKAGEQSPKTAVLTGRHLPIPPSAMSSGIKQIQGTATVYIDGGKYVQVQSPDPRYGESLYYVDPQGVRYGMADQQTASSLGLPSPKTAPWAIIRQLVDGPVLSKDAALLEHDTLPADPTPRKIAGGSGGGP